MRTMLKSQNGVSVILVELGVNVTAIFLRGQSFLSLGVNVQGTYKRVA